MSEPDKHIPYFTSINSDRGRIIRNQSKACGNPVEIKSINARLYPIANSYTAKKLRRHDV